MDATQQIENESLPMQQQPIGQQQQQQIYEQQYPEEQMWQDDIYNGLDELLPSHSKDKPYSIYHLDQLIRKVWQQVEGKALRCCMSNGWTLMLYFFTNFNPNYFDDLIDADSTGRNIIKYREGYLAPERKKGECPVCLTEGELLANPCGHSFCQQCWKGHISLNHTDRNLYELFPLCQEEGCYHRTNYHLMEALWQDDQQLFTSFQRLLCLKYGQQSIQVKLCPNQSCGKAIYFNLQNSIVDSTALCDCGTEVCRFCGAQSHWPLNCVDLRSWNGMVSGRQDQWINGLVVQKCPMCRQTIEKNNGCIHMTCRCKYQFCWICLKVWKGHQSYSACSDLSREDHEKKLMEEQAKRKLDENLYSERLEEARGQTERLTLSIRRITETPLQKLVKRLEEIQVLSIHSALLGEMRDFVKKAWGFVYRTTIYIFFESENALALKRIIFRVNKAADQMDDYLTELLNSKFKELDEKIQKKADKQEGGERQFADAERIKLRLDFDKDREKYSYFMREGVKVLEFVKRGDIIQALQFITSKKCPLNVEKEPVGLNPVQEMPLELESELSHQ